MRPLLIANWKMHPSNSKDAFELAKTVVQELEGVEADAVLCPPFVYVPQLLPACAGRPSSNVFIGAQDCFWEQEGSYTGQVSPQMLKSLGCSHVILGHSERKKLGETPEMVARKVRAALDVALIPVVCIGENTEREMNSILKDIKGTDVSKIVFVYEPEGAISTEPHAKPASGDQLERALIVIRSVLLKKAEKEAAPKTSILYGGSVNSENIRVFMQLGVQGALVGAASLDAQEFVQLVKNAILR